MPELPEVETMRRGILPVVGCQITAAVQPPCDRKPILMQPGIKAFDRRTAGRLITGVGRRGKRVLIELDDDQTIVIEPRMTGLVLLADPPGPQHLRLRLELRGVRSNQSAGPNWLLFWDRRGLGTVRLMKRREFLKQIDAKLGPDALVVKRDELRDRLHASRRAIKVALLDQAVVAGIGNLYAAEILFLA